MIDDFFNQLSFAKNIDAGLDIIFRTFNDLATVGDFANLDEILKEVNPNELELDISVGFLSASWCMRHKLKERNNFVERCQVVFIEKAGRERAERLLKGLGRS